MPDRSATARLEVDLSALTHNYDVIKARGGGAEIAPVIKANAYGLGVDQIAPPLFVHGARTFFVARLSEGVGLRRLLPDEAAIYVLDGLGDGQISTFDKHGLRPVLNNPEQIKLWQSAGAPVPAGLHIDTGMNRLGLSFRDFSQYITNINRDKLTLVMSHLACSDGPGHPMNAQQLINTLTLRDHFTGVPLSLSASGGAFLGSDYALDMIRPGISLYGGGPFGVTHPDIRPVVHLSARVLQVRDLKAGDTVGYGAGFQAPENMQVATIGLGYADGLLRAFAASGTAVIKGGKRRLLGRISMDVFALDVTALEVTTGDWVELIGPGQSLDEVATQAGTIAYEVLTRLAPRIARVYF